MFDLRDRATNNFILTVVIGLLVLVLVVSLYGRLTARYRRPAPIRPTHPSRPVHVRLGYSQGIHCLHCPAILDSFGEMDIHLKFECPGLRRTHDTKSQT